MGQCALLHFNQYHYMLGQWWIFKLSILIILGALKCISLDRI